MMTQTAKKWRVSSLAFVVGLTLAGCAGSAPEPVFVLPFETPERPLEGYTQMILTYEAKPEVEMPEHEQIRVVAFVKQELERRAPGRFVFVKDAKKTSTAATTSGEPAPETEKTVRLHILFTEYDEGDALARFMIAGAGQIRIGTAVKLRDQATDELLGEYEVSKQFAFGGIYGASTDVADVEEGLAKGIVEILVPGTSEGDRARAFA